MHPITIGISYTLYPGRLSLSNLKGELLILRSLLILFQDILPTWESHIYQMYYLSLPVLDCDIRPSSQCSKWTGSARIGKPVRKFSLFLTGSLNR